MMVSKCKSSLFVRCIHTALTIGVLATLLFQETSVSRAFKDGSVNDWLYTSGFLMLVNVSLILYWITCLINPGYVEVKRKHRYDDSDEEAGEGMMQNSSEALTNGVRLRHCGFCGIDQPLRTRHCEECDRCVRKFDHHCPWLETCVGERNHRFFWLFLLTKTAVIGWAFFIVWHSFVSKPDWSQWLKSNAFFLIDAFTLVIAGFVVSCLWGIHTYLMVNNTTTWEFMSRHRISYLKKVDCDNPFHEGYCMNIIRFLCNWSVVKWEAIYNKSIGKVKLKAQVEDDYEEHNLHDIEE